jgi:hypothetical protein
MCSFGKQRSVSGSFALHGHSSTLKSIANKSSITCQPSCNFSTVWDGSSAKEAYNNQRKRTSPIILKGMCPEGMYFSTKPEHQKPEHHVLQAIKHSSERIDISMYAFSSELILAELMVALNRNVVVRILLDTRQNNVRQFESLVSHGCFQACLI